jgi:tRNA(Ile)-lysidine synthase
MTIATVKTARKRPEKGSKRAGRQRVSRFARHLLTEWESLALPMTGERVIVAVSGGADSVALLLSLDELIRAGRFNIEPVVAHLDHGLRDAESALDAVWVAELSERLGYRVVMARAAVKERARLSSDNLEQAARRARYEFLARAASSEGARVVLTAHTMDDQAETVLLRLMRGSGSEGLGGIEPVRSLNIESRVLLARPLLGWARRADTVGYCEKSAVSFRVDEMNRDERFARVRVREHLIPQMQTFNPRVVEALARTAELLREDAAALRESAERLLDEASAEEEEEGGATTDASPLRVDVLLNAPRALRRRALRLWIARGRGDLRRLELVHILAVEKLLAGERGGRVIELPGGAAVTRKRGKIYLKAEGSRQ